MKAWNPEQSCQSVSEQRPDYLWFRISSLWFAQWMLLLKILPLAMAVSAGLLLLSLISFDQCCKYQTAPTHMVWLSDWKVLIPQGSGSIFLLKKIFTAVGLKCFLLSKAAERWCLPEFNVQALSQKAAGNYWQQNQMQTFTLLKYIFTYLFRSIGAMMVLFPWIKGKRSGSFEKWMGYFSLAVVLDNYVFVFIKVYWKCIREWIYSDIHCLMLV